MNEGAPIKSHIAEFNSIINELDKIDDEDQALLLLYSLKILEKSLFIGAKYLSMKLKSICSIKTRLTNSLQVSLIMSLIMINLVRLCLSMKMLRI